MGVAVGAGLACGWVTGWPVAALAVAAFTFFAPVLFGPDQVTRRRVETVEAVAAWTESLRDTIRAAAGLEQAFTVTARHAPPALAAASADLAARIRRGQPVASALSAFAVVVDDETCDLVCVALTQAASTGAHPAAMLDELAELARARAAATERIAASRARVRTSMRVITATTTAMAVGLVAFARDFLTPYHTLTGQLVLAIVAGLFAAALWWMHRLANPPRPARLIHAGGGAS